MVRAETNKADALMMPTGMPSSDAIRPSYEAVGKRLVQASSKVNADPPMGSKIFLSKQWLPVINICALQRPRA
jgi:hypothetical protein